MFIPFWRMHALSGILIIMSNVELIESINKKLMCYVFQKFGFFEIIKFALYVIKIDSLNIRRHNAW